MTNRRLIITFQERKQRFAYMAGTGRRTSQARIEAHARKVLAKMASTRLLNTLRISIILRKKVETMRNGNKALGWSYPRDHAKGKTARAKHYPIKIDNTLPEREIMRVLRHELMHVIQRAKGRLDYRAVKGQGVTYWRPAGHKGRSIAYPHDSTFPEWAERPWEVEAVRAETLYI